MGDYIDVLVSHNRSSETTRTQVRHLRVNTDDRHKPLMTGAGVHFRRGKATPGNGRAGVTGGQAGVAE